MKDAPATKDDIERLELSIRLLIEKSDAQAGQSDRQTEQLTSGLRDLAVTVEQRYHQIQSDIDKVLTLIGNITDRLDDGQSTQKQRIERLERHVGLTTT